MKGFSPKSLIEFIRKHVNPYSLTSINITQFEYTQKIEESSPSNKMRHRFYLATNGETLNLGKAHCLRPALGGTRREGRVGSHQAPRILYNW